MRILAVLLLAAGTAVSVAAPADAAPPTAKGPIGWELYRNLNLLPALSTGVQTKQFSSFDRTGGNSDGTNGGHECLRTTAQGCVIAEHSGPGEIGAIWFTRNSGNVSATGNITITLDGTDVVHTSLQDLVDGKAGAPFSYPLVANADQSSGGVYIEVPMPFRESMRITTDNDPVYYHVSYRTFADASGVSTFDASDPATDVLDMVKAAGTRDPKPALPGASAQTTSLKLAPGASATLAQTHGPGELTELRLTLPQAERVTPRTVADNGRAFGAGGSSQFTIKIDPANTGVRLTRRYDPGIGHQVAQILVDGRPAGQWGPTTPLPSGQWAEESVDLPASLTAGKTQITVKNVFVSSDKDFNEFTYWADDAGSRTDTVDVGNAASQSAHAYVITQQTWQGTRTYTYPLDADQLAKLDTAQQLLQGLRLRISFDGGRTVDSPVGEFFGTGFGVAPVRSLFTEVDPASSSYTAWWPMPYLSDATVQLYNGSSIAVDAGDAQVTSAESAQVAAGLATGAIGYFRTSSHAGATEKGKDWTYLMASGHGKFVGVTAAMTGPSGRGYLEGDERVYTDGSRSPQIHGTGTEDFFQSGWYFNRGTDTLPFNGDPNHLTSGYGCATGSDCTAAYRLMIGDAVPFSSSIDFGIEHGSVDQVDANYSSTAYWYGTSRAALVKTDMLTIGDQTSETAHGYTSSDPGAVTSLTSTYEGNDGPPQPVTADTRATTGPVTFQLSVKPGRNVTLLRTSDQNAGYQQAQVSVDGHRLPDWQEPLANPSHRWLDDTYLLPAWVTAGKNRIAVTLTPVPGGPAWSAASYSAWSAR